MPNTLRRRSTCKCIGQVKKKCAPFFNLKQENKSVYTDIKSLSGVEPKYGDIMLIIFFMCNLATCLDVATLKYFM